MRVFTLLLPTLVGAVVALAPSPGICRPPVAAPAVGREVSAGAGVELRLLTKRARYSLKGDEATIEPTLRQIAAASASEKTSPPPYPEPPRVEMTLRLTNRSKVPIEFWSSGDQVSLKLGLKGPGAVTVAPRLLHTMELIGPKVTTLAPGHSFDIPVTRLGYGFRGDEELAYWTRPGDYTITPSFATAVRPAPSGSKVDQDGFAHMTLVGPPVAIRIEKH